MGKDFGPLIAANFRFVVSMDTRNCCKKRQLLAIDGETVESAVAALANLKSGDPKRLFVTRVLGMAATTTDSGNYAALPSS